MDFVFDGEEALHSALKSDYDLVITDLQMPKRDGVSLIKALRKKDRVMPIVVLSGYINSDLQNELSSHEDITLLGKPIRPDELAGMVAQILKEKQEKEED